MLAVKAPRRELEARLGKTRDMLGRLIKPNTADFLGDGAIAFTGERDEFCKR
jgi:hypothetical protein